LHQQFEKMQQNPIITWYVILNPHAGCGKGERDKEIIVDILKKSDLNFQLLVSEYPGHIVEITKELAQNGATNFIIAGGDGSLNEAINGIFKTKIEHDEKIKIGVIPVGTGNDWIKTFGIPDNYQKAVEIITTGSTVIQAVGEIVNHNRPDEKRYFVNVVGFGFDAMVAGRANMLKNKGISGLRVYIQSFIWSYRNFKSGLTIIEIDNTKNRVNLFSTSVGIGKYNGGGFMQVPDANPLEGRFHITIIRKIGVWGILKNFIGLYDGSFVKDHRVSTHAGKTIRIRALGPLPCEADGESLGQGNYTVTIIPHRLQVICNKIKFPT
jgi:YegS/Rv2252/BmrU family lipid kinase